LTDTNFVFDIGANTGQDTAALLSRGLRVVAIEAKPKLCVDLRARLLVEPLDSPAAAASLLLRGVLSGSWRR
jgi:FkbM family methyltransferase